MKHKTIRILISLLFVALIFTAPRAQQPAATSQQSSADRIALYQALLDLTNPWTVMCVAAHPDDEDGTSLIVMRHKYGAHTVSLFSTFGEGGQNAIGPELYEELGAIRARETMAAAEIQGSEPYFLGLKDFGYSKTRDEAFKFWGHEEALRRMVLEIRKLRPDVIITNHSITSNDHGQHQATALMVVEAFDAAADPNKFPEQLKDGVTAWQVQRLFVRVRGQNPDRQGGGDQIVTIDPNEADPVRGTIFAEQALTALQKHATQGPWPKTFAEFTARFRAFSGQSGASGQMPLIRYRLEREAKGADALAKDSHNFTDGLTSASEIAAVTTAMDNVRRRIRELVDNRDELSRGLVDLEKQIDLLNLPARSSNVARIRGIYLTVGNALALSNGVSMRVVAQKPTISPGDSTGLSVIVTNSSKDTARVYGFSISPSNSRPTLKRSQDGTLANASFNYEKELRIDPGQVSSFSDELLVPGDARRNVPQALHLYDSDVFGEQITESATVRIRNVSFPIVASTRIDIGRPVEIMSITPSPIVIGVASGHSRASKIDVSILVTNQGTDSFAGQLAAMTGSSAVTVDKVDVAMSRTKSVTLSLDTKKLLTAARSSSKSTVPFVLTRNRERIADRPVPVITVNTEVIPDLRVGYIRGFDFSLPNALNALGVESKELSVDEVKTADLLKYTSIIVDNRVYESQPELIAANQKLLDYAKAGGNLIVFYHKSDEWNPDARRNRPQLAPYKLILGNERITDENAPVTFLEPDHPLLNAPNKLNQDDLKDWIQERGLYYPREWDPQFHALLQSNDPNGQPLKGGLLVADYGSGHYIYTSMVWYRQLRAGVPGAYRMLANMISYGRTN